MQGLEQFPSTQGIDVEAVLHGWVLGEQKTEAAGKGFVGVEIRQGALSVQGLRSVLNRCGEFRLHACQSCVVKDAPRDEKSIAAKLGPICGGEGKGGSRGGGRKTGSGHADDGTCPERPFGPCMPTKVDEIPTMGAIRQPDRQWHPAFPHRAGGLGDLQLLHATWQDRLHARIASRERTPHVHDVYHVVPIISGTGTFVVGTEVIAVAAPYLFLIPPGVPHSFTGGPGEDSIYSECTFRGESSPGRPLRLSWPALLEDWFQGPCPVPIHGPAPAACVAALDREIADLAALGLAGHPFAEGHARAAILAVLATIWRFLVADAVARTDPVAEARRILEERLDDPPSAEELACAVGWPSKRLIRRFTARYGCPPGRYRQQAAMARAADLLRGSALSVAGVAERLGFTDVRYFSRIFTRMHGLSPARWRRGSSSA